MATRDYSEVQEKRVAKKLGGVVQIGSGATPFLKGDVALDTWLVECKTKTKDSKSHSLQREWFKKAKEQSFGCAKDNYALAFDFGDGEDYVAVDISTFAYLLECEEYFLKNMQNDVD